MSSADGPTAAAAERGLALGYARADRRAGLAALFALDARLGDIVRAARQPLVGQMRLTWWREALAALDDAPAPAEPVLAALARDALPLSVRGRDLAGLSAGWEELLADPLDGPAMAAFAAGRGGLLFGQASLLLAGRPCDVAAAAGEGWALADLARRVRDPRLADRAAAAAQDRLTAIAGRYWPRPLRPLGALALLARSDLVGGAPGSPGRVARLLFHRLTGR